jgi:Big-like domain-containing protein
MSSRVLIISLGVLFGLSSSAQAQTKLKLSAIKPGTEQVQLAPNGDFQFEGPLVSGSYANPIGWSRSGDMFVTGGSNMVTLDGGAVAQAQLLSGAAASGYSQSVTLEPAMAYVFSGYLWNMGDAANHVSTVMDFTDAPGEPQIVLSASDSEADKGYFVYRSFNTSTTGTNVTVRVFYDGLAGTGASVAYFPVAAQWDNIAITKASRFLAPATSGNVRPQVTITNPANNSFVYVNSLAGGLTVSATANDLDGNVTNVQFFAGTNSMGERSASPWSITASNLASGSYVLTALAADNSGATTFSAPVSITLNAFPLPPELAVSASGTNAQVFWPTGNLAMVVQTTSNLAAPVTWSNVTNSINASNQFNAVAWPATNASQFFRLASEVDPSTMFHKLLMGYQGWFACAGDGSPVGSWVHWFRNNNPVATNATVDFWPDVSEFDADELFNTAMTLPGGAPAKLYSAYKQKTVLRHFKWMRDNHLDGVFLQRFSSELSSSSFFALRNQVAANVRAGADTYGRAFAVMYDISGQPTNTLVSTLTNDWNYLVNSMQLTASPFYLRHHGKPVVAIWGFGFSGRPDTPAQAQQVINFFRSAGCTVVGGLPTYWRTLNNDAQSDPAWSGVFRSFDILSPWSVGRYADDAGADNFRVNLIVPDKAAVAAAGREYMPVIFPGFSWHNLNAGPLNQIPRRAGAFYWRQAYNAVLSGCTMIYGAMFDEVDEGTAMYKLAATAQQLPAQGTFVPLDIDGTSLPSDWYLRLANEAGKMLRGESPAQSAVPITP